jgi:hypothetical protein
VLRIGAGYYYGPGQTEDQVQPIDSDRASRTLTSGIAFPVNPVTVLAGFNPNDPNLGYQPRGYSSGYRLPEKVLSYTASIQQQLPGTRSSPSRTWAARAAIFSCDRGPTESWA